jgi:rare lipoprotein A
MGRSECPHHHSNDADELLNKGLDLSKLLIGAALVAAFLLPVSARADTCKTSFYHEGRLTANGERFRPDGLTAAHRSLPFGTRLRVTYAGRSVVVRINDRGPAVWTGRCLDLSRGAGRVLGMIKSGVVTTTFEKV